MANLSFFEKRKLEEFLGMGSGYVLDFSNRTFQEFVADSAGRDIFADKYDYASGSKANRMRAFWEKEPNQVVGKLLDDLITYGKDRSHVSDTLMAACRGVVQRLMHDAPVHDIEAISAFSAEKDFELIAKGVRDAIERNEPESGLDRLHTFVVKYIRLLCEKHGIAVTRDKPLHSLFGEYVKKLKRSGLIESEMTERILKSSISLFEAFNRVRNEQSLAHDNPVLNYGESLLIFNNVSSSIRFLTALEKEQDGPATIEEDGADSDIPF